MLIELFIRAVCFPVGWSIVKVLTGGKYPSKGSWFASTAESQWTTGAGFVVIVLAIMVALKQFAL